MHIQIFVCVDGVWRQHGDGKGGKAHSYPGPSHFCFLAIATLEHQSVFLFQVFRAVGFLSVHWRFVLVLCHHFHRMQSCDTIWEKGRRSLPNCISCERNSHQRAVLLFYFQDYIEPSSGLITIVAGAVFGTILLLAFLFIGLWFFIRRKNGAVSGAIVTAAPPHVADAHQSAHLHHRGSETSAASAQPSFLSVNSTLAGESLCLSKEPQISVKSFALLLVILCVITGIHGSLRSVIFLWGVKEHASWFLLMSALRKYHPRWEQKSLGQLINLRMRATFEEISNTNAYQNSISSLSAF